MNTLARLALSGAMVVFAGGAALAEDHETGVPLVPREAAGSWTLESGGHSICVVRLGAEKSAAGAYRAEAQGCGEALPAGVTGWTPAPDGMNLVDARGTTLIDFGRWSNSLLVSHRSSGEDIQLRRGT